MEGVGGRGVLLLPCGLRILSLSFLTCTMELTSLPPESQDQRPHRAPTPRRPDRAGLRRARLVAGDPASYWGKGVGRGL